jgi:SWI/SNF-related matrix-associated actin-dependent regulator of chromatin subfamily A member 5
VQNNLLELWGLLHWLCPSVFRANDASEHLFKNSFDLRRGSYSIPFLNVSTQFLSAIMLRRTKAVVAGNEVPPREELTVYVPLTDAQRFWTYRLLTKLDTPNLRKIFTDIKLENDETLSPGQQGIKGDPVPATSDSGVHGNRKALFSYLRA